MESEITAKCILQQRMSSAGLCPAPSNRCVHHFVLKKTCVRQRRHMERVKTNDAVYIYAGHNGWYRCYTIIIYMQSLVYATTVTNVLMVSLIVLIYVLQTHLPHNYYNEND